MTAFQKVFEEELNKFDTKVFSSFGYKKAQGPVSENGGVSYLFTRIEQALDIWLTGIESEVDGAKIIVFTMFKQRTFGNPERKDFSLVDYLERHNISDIKYRCERSEDPESFVKNYFTSLEKAFHTHLRDQVTGASFETHSPLGK